MGKDLTAAETKARILEDIEYLAVEGLKKAKGLFLSPEDPGYNPDAIRPWVEATTTTRFSLEIYKQLQANRREREATTRALGVIVLRGQVEAGEWEKRALEVDEESRKKTIDIAERLLPEGEK